MKYTITHNGNTKTANTPRSAVIASGILWERAGDRNADMPTIEPADAEAAQALAEYEDYLQRLFSHPHPGNYRKA